MINPVYVTPDHIIHFTFCDVVVDSFWYLKNKTHIESPFVNARLEYWAEVEELFDFYPCDLFYWKHPPTLELPERAQSLSEWSHCHWCGYPLDAPTLFPCPGYWEEML